MDSVYIPMSWPAKVAELFESSVPDPYITKAPRDRNTTANNEVMIYPKLKSSKVSFKLGL